MEPSTPPILQELVADSSWLRSLARDLVGRGVDADDAVQDALLSALEHPPATDRPLRPWLRRVLTNALRLGRRSAARRRTREERARELPAVPEPAELLLRAELQWNVARAIAELPEPQRRAVLLRYYRGQTAEEIARAERVSSEVVRQRLKRGRDRLRSALDERFGDRQAWGGVLLALAHEAPGAGHGAWIRARELVRETLHGTGRSLAMRVAITTLTLGGLATLVMLSRDPREPGAGAGAAWGRAPPTPHRAAVAVERPAAAVSRGSALLVRVRREGSDTPVAGEVVLVERDGARLPYREELRVRTDERGEAHLADLDPGVLRVGLLRRGDERDRIELRAGREERLDLELPPGYALEGVVRDEHGYTLPGALVWVSEPWDRLRGHVLTTTDDRGRFRLEDVKASGMHWVGARGARHAPGPVTYFDAAPGEAVECTLVLDRPAAALSGRVLDADGRPVPAAELLVGYESPQWACAQGGSPPCRLAADSDGGFRCEDLAPGPQPVRVRAPGYAALMRELDLVPEVEQGIVLTLAPEPIVSGRVTDEKGKPVADVRIASGDGNGFGTARAWSDEHGRFELRGAPLGSVRLQAGAEELGCDRVVLDLAPGRKATWNPVLRPVPRVFGSVRDAKRRPVGGRELALWEHTERRNARYTFTDERGDFAFEAEPDVPHVLVVESDSDAFPSLVLRDVEAALEPLDLRLDDGKNRASVVGRVLGPGGEPVEAARIGVWHRALQLGHDAPLGSDGTFALELPGGPVWLEIRAEGEAPLLLGERELRPGERLDLGQLALSVPAFVGGSFAGERSPDPDSMRVDWVLDPGRDPLAGEILRDGFRSPPLPPGRVRAIVQGEGVERVEFEVTVQAGAELHRTVHLAAAPTLLVILELPSGAPRPTFLRATLNDPSGDLRWSLAHTPTPAGPLTLTISARAGDYELRVQTDTALAGSASVSIQDGKNDTVRLGLR